MDITIVTLCLLLLTILPQSYSQPHDNNYTVCSRPFNCGPKVSNISYPFWADQQRPDYCGGGKDFSLHCDDNQFISIQIGSQSYGVLEINNTAYTMAMIRQDLVHDVCFPQFYGNDLGPSLFLNPETRHNITIFYYCPRGGWFGGNNHTCSNENSIAFFEDVNDTLYDTYPDLHDCIGSRFQVPASQSLEPDGGIDALKRVLGYGFTVNYSVPNAQECKTCWERKGACGTNDTSNYQFSCHCPDGSDASDCSAHSKLSTFGLKIGIGVAAVMLSAFAMSIVFAGYLHHHRKKNHHAISYIKSRSMSYDHSLNDTEKGVVYFGVSLFTYNELEEATNNFDSSRELGDGGFGTVYFGILRDGRCVAVKRLYENNYKRVKQFKNEVEILSRLRHSNLVSLYGYTSRHSRELLLVYEYIPNGTVADHLHGQRAKPGTLPWHIRMNIAVETASALKYLHASKIIHRDVKTNNILLDDHFCVKVADFGLSRLFPPNVTHISTDPKGTPGYLAPEIYECYQLTDKTDVYSFGVVLTELISSLPAVDMTRHTHEINLANMTINKINNQALHELVDQTLGFDSDYKVRKMINGVAELAFRCLQNSKDTRPSMEEVLGTLKDIQSHGKCKSQPKVLDISGDDVVLLKDDPPPPSPASNVVSISTTPNVRG